MTGSENFSQSSRLQLAKQRFAALYGDGEIRALSAPARINILGEHIDYVSYLPTASLTFGSHQHAMLMLYRPNNAGLVRGASTHDSYAPFSLSLKDVADNLGGVTQWENFVFNRATPAAHWSTYVTGATHYARWQHGETIQQGFDFLVDSTIPACGGSSSSSALTCLAGAALRAVNGVTISNHELAMASSKAEWFIGTRGGAMDHLTICLSQPDSAILIEHAPQNTTRVNLPADGYAWVTFFSHEADKGSGVMLEYNERAAVSRLIIPALLENENVSSLPEFVTLAELATQHPAAYAECEKLFPQFVQTRQHAQLKVRAYAEHHSGEIRRVNESIQLLNAESPVSDNTMRKLGALLNETHASLRDLYAISTPEVESLRALILEDALVYGARLMGGGFGGNVLALVRTEGIKPLIERVQCDFYAPRGRHGVNEGAVMVSLPGAGLRDLLHQD